MSVVLGAWPRAQHRGNLLENQVFYHGKDVGNGHRMAARHEASVSLQPGQPSGCLLSRSLFELELLEPGN